MIIMGFKKMYSSEKVWWDLMTGETNYNYNEATFPLVCHDHHAPCWTPCWCLLRRLKLSHFQLESGWLVVIRPPATPTTLLSSSSSKKNNDKKTPNPNCCCQVVGGVAIIRLNQPGLFTRCSEAGNHPTRPDVAAGTSSHNYHSGTKFQKLPREFPKIVLLWLTHSEGCCGGSRVRGHKPQWTDAFVGIFSLTGQSPPARCCPLLETEGLCVSVSWQTEYLTGRSGIKVAKVFTFCTSAEVQILL